jgi:N-acetyl-anhydromuramyl-L-alanine amidase AmpD
MALRYGSHGEAVEVLQRNLLGLGYPLPKWGADGDLGLETWNALRAFAERAGAPLPDGEPGAVVPDALVTAIAAAAAALPAPDRPANFVDVTRDHEGKQRRGARPWGQITGIVLHQTAVLLGPNPTRWHDIAAHVGIPQDGAVILINPLDQLIWHANALNKSTVGIEISGNFEGVDGDASTYWKPGGGPHRATDEQIAAARSVVGWICREIAAQGGSVRYLFAHRQASSDRRADPGSRVWQEVALWCQQQYALSDGGPGHAVGSGYPIPREWDSRRTETY